MWKQGIIQNYKCHRHLFALQNLFFLLDVAIKVENAAALHAYDNNNGPHIAIDGNREGGMFHSDCTKGFPWLELNLSEPRNVSGVLIVNRRGGQGHRLKNLEIRAGRNPQSEETKEVRLSNNPKFGSFEGPGKDNVMYAIEFDEVVAVQYITLQLVGKECFNVHEVTVFGVQGMFIFKMFNLAFLVLNSKLYIVKTKNKR